MARETQQPTQGPSSVRKISGTQPGILDSTQSSRLLRLPGARLSFAVFDPLTACSLNFSGLVNPRLNTDLYRPKRVVIETAPSGVCSWRFVPSAKRENGVVDEGAWPRIVDVCGEIAELTQDQWDIYKLDPHYECFVPGESQITTIRKVPQPHPLSPQPIGKRRLLSRSPSPRRAMPPPNPSVFLQSDSDDEDEDEVEAIVTGDDDIQIFPRRRRTRESREQLENRRQERREKIRRKIELYSQDDEMYRNVFVNGTPFGSDVQPSEQRNTTPEPSKRKAACVLDTSWSPDARELEELRTRFAANYIFASAGKRTRISSPQGPWKERELRQKRMARAKAKQQKRMEEADARKRGREKRFLDEIIEEITQTMSEDALINDVSMTQDDLFSQTEETHYEESPNTRSPNAEEAAHHETIEESRRKLAELERDRPLWEEEARRRQLREEAERQAHKTRKEERRREEAIKKAEIEARALKERQEEETKKREQEKNAQRARELREQERRQRQQRWSFGPWTTQRALERYRILSESFDATKFTYELPLDVEDVPWPSLDSPKNFLLEDISWDSVERFFEAIRSHLKPQDYKILVEQSHRRFHPDRWRSRNLLKTVEDEVIRGCMEVAANTVAQALTPIWRGLKSR